MIYKFLKIFFCFFIISCTSKDKNIEKNVLDNDKVIFNQAINEIKNERYEKAIEKFKSITNEFPYSEYSSQSKLYNAYLNYQINKFDNAIVLLTDFISMNPSEEYSSYAHYLLAMCYYVQIANPDRDGEFTKMSIKKFKYLRTKFPNSKFSKDAKYKLDFLNDYMAKKEFNIAMFYLRQNAPSPAITRFSFILKNYQETSVIPQTLYRIAESFMMLGLKTEAEKSFKLLSTNFPKSKWTKELQNLLYKNNNPIKKEKSFFQRIFN